MILCSLRDDFVCPPDWQVVSTIVIG